MRQLVDKMKMAEGMMDRNSCSNGRLKSKSTWFMSSRPLTTAEEDMIAHMCVGQKRLSKNQIPSIIWSQSEHLKDQHGLYEVNIMAA
jgi:hypothetical protein